MKEAQINRVIFSLVFLIGFVNISWSAYRGRTLRTGLARTAGSANHTHRKTGARQTGRRIAYNEVTVDTVIAGRVTLFTEYDLQGSQYYEHYIDACKDVNSFFVNRTNSLDTHGTCFHVCNMPCSELWNVYCETFDRCDADYNNGIYNNLSNHLHIASLRPCNYTDYQKCPYRIPQKESGNGTACDVNDCAIEIGCKSYKVCLPNTSDYENITNPDESIGEIVEIGCPKNYFPQAIDIYNSEPGKVALAACRRWEDLDYTRKVEIFEDPHCAPCQFIANDTCSSYFKYRNKAGIVSNWLNCPDGLVIDVKLRSCVKPCEATGALLGECYYKGYCRDQGNHTGLGWSQFPVKSKATPKIQTSVLAGEEIYSKT